jgi:protein-tyrosine phosphatase
MRTRIFWIHPQVGIMGRPMGGDDLLEEIHNWQKLEIKTIVSFLTDEENEELDLEFERMDCTRVGLEFIKYPIEPKEAPDSFIKTKAILVQLLAQVNRGERMLLHSRAGIGRSAVFGLLLLHALGWTYEDALAHIIAYRGVQIPDNEEQLKWVKTYCQR